MTLFISPSYPLCSWDANNPDWSCRSKTKSCKAPALWAAPRIRPSHGILHSSILLWVCVMGLRFLCVFPLSVPPPLQALNPDRDSKHWAALTEEPDDESVWNGASGNGDEVVIHSAWIFTSSQENPADGARTMAVRVPCVHSSGCVWVFYCSLRSFMASSAHFHTY